MRERLIDVMLRLRNKARNGVLPYEENKDKSPSSHIIYLSKNPLKESTQDEQFYDIISSIDNGEAKVRDNSRIRAILKVVNNQPTQIVLSGSFIGYIDLTSKTLPIISC